MKKVLICPDSYKECLSSEKVAESIKNGINKADPNIITTCICGSDGGEGFLDCMEKLFPCKRVYHTSHDPLNREIKTYYLLSSDGKTAFAELARTGGLALVSKSERNIMKSTTFGTGETIKCAIKDGAKRIILGIGGSATNDCGVGLLSALGARFFDSEGRSVPAAPDAIERISEVDTSSFCFGSDVSFVAACDVENPLCGDQGAAVVFAGQKGASDDQKAVLEQSAASFSKAVGFDATTPGSGAAGGVGFAMLHFLKAQYKSGAELLLESEAFEKELKSASLVITGEGRTDSQTVHGKFVCRLAEKAKRFDVPAVVISGSLQGDISELYGRGVTAAFSVSPGACSLEYCIKNAEALICRTAFDVARLYFCD